MGGTGDPGDEDVVGVVDEVLARQRVDPLAFAAQVRGGDRDELAVARGRRGRLRLREQHDAVGGREERFDHELSQELVHEGDVCERR